MKNKIAAIVLVGVVISAGLLLLVNSALADVGVSTATAPEEEWSKTFGGRKWDFAESVQQTSDGGYIIAGAKGSEGRSSGGGDAWLIKTNSKGRKQWDKTFGGSDRDWANSVQQTSDGGYIIAGETHSYVVDGVIGGGDLWLIKTNSKGRKQWDKTFGGSDRDWANSVRQTSDEGYIIAGETRSYGAGSGDFWLIKTDYNGIEQWNKTFGGDDWDLAESVQQTSDGGYIITGATGSYGAGEMDAWLIKTDSNGNEQWNKTFGGKKRDWAKSVQQTSDGGYIFAGTPGADPGSSWLIKTDSNGNEQWNKTYGGRSAKSVQQTSDGGYIFAGYGGSPWNARLIKTDSDGDKQWGMTFGKRSEYDRASSVQQTSDGGYIIAGSTSSYGAGKSDAWLIKVGGSGESTINAPDIEKPPEKAIPGFGFLGAMFAVFVMFLLKKRRA